MKSDIRNRILKEIIDASGFQIIDAKTFHTSLKIAMEFYTWMQCKINQYDMIKDKDYIQFEDNGQQEYYLDVDRAMIISLDENCPDSVDMIRLLYQGKHLYKEILDTIAIKKAHENALYKQIAKEAILIEFPQENYKLFNLNINPTIISKN